MKRVKYIAEYYGELPTKGLLIAPGDVIEVEDDFENVLFVLEGDAPEAPSALEDPTVSEAPESQEVPEAPEEDPNLKGDN